MKLTRRFFNANVDQETKNLEGLLKLDLQYFAEGGEGGSAGDGGQAGSGEGGQAGSGEGGSGGGEGGQGSGQGEGAGQGKGEGEGAGEGDKDNTFTQDDVNNMIAKEKKEVQEKLLKQLGVDDFKNAKEGMKKFKEWQDSQKTEAEKQAEQLKSLENEKGTLSEENETLKAQLSATNAGVKSDSVADVVTLAKNLISDDVDMDAAIKKVVEKYPHFAGEGQEGEGGNPSFSTGEHKKEGKTDAFAKTLLGK